MKKLQYLIFAFLFCFKLSTRAQGFSEGDIMINAGLGIGSNYLPGSEFKTVFPPLFLAIDYCVKEEVGPGSVGVGGYIGYISKKSVYVENSWWGEFGYTYKTLMLGARATYNYSLFDNFDAYVGMILGYPFANVEYYGNEFGKTIANKEKPALLYGFFAGARYYFTENFGVFAELGYSTSFFSIGASYKFGLH